MAIMFDKKDSLEIHKINMSTRKYCENIIHCILARTQS